MKISAVSDFNKLTYCKADVQSSNIDNSKICKDNNCNKKRATNWTAVTGWATLFGIAATGTTGLLHNPKLHTITASIPILAGIAHVACISSHHKYHNKDIIA